ncbi:hypothetical protein AVEN_98910-1 [Araneus ventricosus]|uniref:Uncharacterized protein n=1 Tax=Araneus ventricosus TaxID=182803 RepID=A0A4Y2TB52_ARAVE|nr:hypothetical protein AVEN_98910-1 [Araneus ventricosus]
MFRSLLNPCRLRRYHHKISSYAVRRRQDRRSLSSTRSHLTPRFNFTLLQCSAHCRSRDEQAQSMDTKEQKRICRWCNVIQGYITNRISRAGSGYIKS